jgi:adenylate cyclase
VQRPPCGNPSLRYSWLLAAHGGRRGRYACPSQATAGRVIEPKIAHFNGHTVGSAGDSLLIEFSSAVDVVQCAVELQDILEDENASLPESRRMAFRMGANLGDVIAEGRYDLRRWREHRIAAGKACGSR